MPEHAHLTRGEEGIVSFGTLGQTPSAVVISLLIAAGTALSAPTGKAVFATAPAAGPMLFGDFSPQAASGAVQSDAAINFTLDDGTVDTLVGVQTGGQFIWMNRFTPAPTDFPFSVTQVQALFGFHVAVGDAMQVVVLQDTDGDGDPSNAQVLYSENFAAQFHDGSTWSIFNLTTPVVCFGPGDVLVGLVNRSGADGYLDYPAAMDQSTSQSRSWLGGYSGGVVPDPITMPPDGVWDLADNFGFAGNWMIRAVAQPGGGRGITGVITRKDKSGLAGASVVFSNGGPTVTTDAQGAFTGWVRATWTGSITPSAPSQGFKPPSRTIKKAPKAGKSDKVQKFKAFDLP
jgi:hypothetical protein